MKTQTVHVDVDGSDMPVYQAIPDGPRGGVVVIQEAFGVNDHIEDVTRRFAAAGYHAVAPHLFHRSGGGSVGYDNFAAIMPLFEGLTDEAVVADLDGARTVLHGAGLADGSIGVVGFCFGGRVSFLAALERELGAAVGFYGGGIGKAGRMGHAALVGLAAELRTPWLGLFGDQDQGIAVDEVEAIRAALAAGAATDHQVVRYPDATHGFHCDARPAYHQPSATDAWDRTLRWLEAHLSPV
jgi:carboxymethylenebutenolidase